MYRIAHITDIHIKYDNPAPNVTKFRALLMDAISSGCDHIVLTGDIADYADERDYAIIRGVLDEFDLLNSSRLSVIPGNHDIYGGPSPELPFFMYPTRCKELDYGSMLNQFYNSFIETFENIVTSKTSFLPYIKLLNNDVAVIAINSIAEYSRDMNPLGTNGLVSGKQLKEIDELAEIAGIKNKVKIVLIHHHFNKPGENKNHPEHTLWLKTEQWKMRIHDKGSIFDFFKKHKVNMVLHGHTHITDTYARKGTFFVNSSGCSIPFTTTGIREYHIIEIGGEDKAPFRLIKREVN
ncbi:MAG: metallophosphoesterase [Ignavibacteriae bacterium]|nr:metallophosphoesterase [Ignavibacteriota bacterium]MCB9243092.1 metallophosphoesterase [Ignavibacteriales bacterium]